MALQQGGWHRGDVEGREYPAGPARRLAVSGDRAEQRIAEVEPVPAPARSLDAGLEAPDCVPQRLGGVRTRRVHAVGDLPRKLHRLGTAHGADLQRQVLLDRPGCGADAGIGVEVAGEVDRALVENRAHDLVCLAQVGNRTCALPLHPILLQHCDVADPEDDLGPPIAELVEGRGQLRDVGRVAHVDGRDARSQPDSLGLPRAGGEQHPAVLVVDLVGAVAAVEPQFVGNPDRIQKLMGWLLGQHLKACQHEPSLTAGSRASNPVDAFRL